MQLKKTIFTLLAFLSFSLSAIAAVNINTATQEEIETLSGIGPVKAKSIVDYRKAHGGFKSVDELENVDGIGAATLNNLRKDVSVTGKTTVAEPEEKKPAKIKKQAKEAKAVGNEKAAASGKTADTKLPKEAKTDKLAKEPKAAK